MSISAQNTMNVKTPTSIAAFQAKSAADKVLSYMWYIHVLVSVNTEVRLRTKISRVLEEHSISPNASSLPGSTSSFDDQQRKSPDNHNQQQQQQQKQKQKQKQSLIDLTDHLVLGLFSQTILTHLIDVPPVYAQGNGYACILADIPMFLREEFCRRLYTLLFSQCIVEWPHGIDVPEPCIPAAEPVLASAAVAAAVEDVPIKLENHTSPSSVEDREEKEDVTISAGLDGVMEIKDDQHSRSPASSSLRPTASIWLQTPSLSSWDSDEDIAHMDRATYFGTVSSPLPMDYFADWEWSRNEFGPHRDSIDEQSMSGVQLMAPFPSPQQQQQQGRASHETFQTGPCESNRIQPQSPHAHQQSRGTPSVMYGDDFENHGCEVTGWSSSSNHDFGSPRLGRSDRVGMGHAASKQPFVSDEHRNLGSRWNRASPVTGASSIPANGPQLGYIASSLRSAEQARVRQLAYARSDLQGIDAGRRADIFRAT